MVLSKGWLASRHSVHSKGLLNLSAALHVVSPTRSRRPTTARHDCGHGSHRWSIMAKKAAAAATEDHLFINVLAESVAGIHGVHSPRPDPVPLLPARRNSGTIICSFILQAFPIEKSG